MLPAGIASTGFPRVEATCRQIGIEFDPWQVDLNRCILAKTSDGLYAADTVVMSIPRQVGKTFDVGAVVFAECIAEPGTTVVWTAHRFKVSRETFNELRALAKSPALAPHIDYDAITTAAGNECIPFRNGSRIVFAARERGAIRGFTKVRILILDEAQILTDAQLADLAPTMNQAENPLIILMGTPPKPNDPGEVFTNLRADALEQFRTLGHSEDGVLFVEFSADPALSADDRVAWKQANPSHPRRTPARAILRMRKLLSDDDFGREALGRWDDDSSSAALDLKAWRDGTDPASAPETVAAFGIEVALDRRAASIGTVGVREDGLPHVELIEHRQGARWLVERCIELDVQHGPAPFVVDGAGPAGSFVEELELAGLEVIVLNTRDVGHACAWLVDANAEGLLRHGPQPELDAAAIGARLRDIGDGLFAFGRRKSTVNIGPLVAVTVAAHVLPSVLPLSDVSAGFL